MFPLPATSRADGRAGFTLLELLVVIAIIAVLAGILLAVFGGVQNRARKVQAASDLRSAQTAIIAYYNDYQKYPLNSVQQLAVTNGAGDTVYGDPGPSPGSNPLYTSADLFDILRAVADSGFNQNNVLNPNQVVYWAGGFAKSATQPRSGIASQDVTLKNGNKIVKGALVDPWGNSYIFFIDANRDNDLSAIIHSFYSDVPAAVGTIKVDGPPLGIGYCCMGPDGKFGTNGNGILKGSDDIVSWQ